MDPSHQLACLYQSGFDLQTFDRFPRAVGVVRDNCIALLEATPERLETLWRFRADLEQLLASAA